MRKPSSVLLLAVSVLTPSAPAVAGPGVQPGENPRLSPRLTQAQVVDSLSAGQLTDVRFHGRRIFSTSFNTLDGLGDGHPDANDASCLSASSTTCNRPTLQGNPVEGNGTFLRLNGLDSQSCLECHAVNSTAAIPATLAVGGHSGVATNVFAGPDALDAADLDGNGFAAYNGRFINPPFVFGSGGVELVAKEMASELQKIAAHAKAEPGIWLELSTHGVDFGQIRYLPWDLCPQPVLDARAIRAERTAKLGLESAAGDNALTVQGHPFARLDTARIRPIYEDSAFCLDSTRLVGIDTDLVVRPFGRKGTNATTRNFDEGAMAFHFGIQPVEAVGPGDPDQDGVEDELTAGEMSALAIFNTHLERPFMDPLDSQARLGLKSFQKIGCADCHRPVLKTISSVLSYSYPEIDADPYANIFFKTDLSEPPPAFPKTTAGGIYVPLFSDLKRHDMGERLQETLRDATPRENREFVTARLWGIADSGPYLHDGRASTLTEAIRWHGGEAEAAGTAFESLPDHQKESLLHFLRHLRTPTCVSADLDGHLPCPRPYEQDINQVRELAPYL